MKSILGVFLRSTCIGNAAIYHCDKVDENSLIVEEVFFNISHILKEPHRSQLSQHSNSISQNLG